MSGSWPPHTIPVDGAARAREPFPDLARHERLRRLSTLPAGQQPGWDGHPDLACIRAELADLPVLAARPDIAELRRELARVAAGQALVLHVGECAELFAMGDPDHVARRLALYGRLADRLAAASGRDVVLVARMAGQYAKPRSQSIQTLPDGTGLPAYRGDAVNGVDPDAKARRADPWRLLTGYDRARSTLEQIIGDRQSERRRIFVSHEALLKDYEEPLSRGEEPGLFAGSAHLVWVGERTREPEGWHIRWAAAVANPVGVKLGPGSSPGDVLALLKLLNPAREPGRLTLITRMGAQNTAERVKVLADAVGWAGVPVVWQCDPMHGNTRKAGGLKLRLLPDIRAEVGDFVRGLRALGQTPGGLHLEVTPEDVAECGEGPQDVDPRSSPPCDPRLNAEQAADIIDHFAREIRD